MLLGFILGVTFGVILMAIVQINYVNKEFESDCKELTENYESFTYDCMNDSEEGNDDIPKIN